GGSGAALRVLRRRLPGRFDDVAVRVAALHAHVLGLVPLLDDRDAVGGEPVAEAPHLLRRGQAFPEVEEPRQPDRLVGGAEREREAVRVVEHQHAVVVPPRRARAEAEVRLVESAATAPGHARRVRGASSTEAYAWLPP